MAASTSYKPDSAQYDSAEDASNQGYGPTGSSRSYPKGSSRPGNSQSAPFNPRNQAATDIYTGGV